MAARVNSGWGETMAPSARLQSRSPMVLVGIKHPATLPKTKTHKTHTGHGTKRTHKKRACNKHSSKQYGVY